MIIAIDTSTEFAGVAALKDGSVAGECTWHCGQSHTIQLLPQLANLLKQSNMDMQDAKCVVVATGPGSFNGLRVGLSTAKGLAFSLDIPIVGISTLSATAYQHAECGLPVCAVTGAGRGELAAATYKMARHEWRQIAAEHIATPQALSEEINTKTMVCGEAKEETWSLLKKLLGSKMVLPTPASLPRRAAYLAELGSIRFKAGDMDDVATLQPIYMRRPPITEPKKILTPGGIDGKLA
jgi:tRNA threonylcarbamoyl adenosine modification protein YeaZ